MLSLKTHTFTDVNKNLPLSLSSIVLSLKMCVIFADMFLAQAGNDSTGVYTEEQLVYLCIDLFLGGSETTSKSQQVMIYSQVKLKGS